MKIIVPEIRQISLAETLPIRHKVMWPNKSIAYVQLPNDEEAFHFGLFLGEEIASIISIFETNEEAQFRKFATLEKYQRLGYGTILLNKIIEVVETKGIKKLWCNARSEKSNFYKRFGLYPSGKYFMKGGIEYLIMEKKL